MLLAVPFVVIVTAFVIIGMASVSQSNSSAFVSWLGQQLGATGTVLGLGLKAALDLSRWATHKLGEHFAGIERLAVDWLAGLFFYADKVLTFTFLWPLELGKFAFWLLDVEIPRLIRALPGAATQIVQRTVYRVQRIERTIVKLPKLSRKQAEALIGAAVATYIAPYLYPLRWLRTHFHALTAVLPHTLPIPFGRTIAQIKRRLRRLERENVLSATAVGAVAFALTRLGLSWMRCNSFRRLGKRIGCGGFAFLEELLFTGFSAFVVTDLCRFTDLLIKQAERLRPALMELVDVEDALVNCHGTVKPPDFVLPALSLPPMPSPSVLAA